MDLLSKEELDAAVEFVTNHKLCIETPILSGMHRFFPDLQEQWPGTELSFKLESMQTTGSFKIRGVVWQMSKLEDSEAPLVSYSAGNYGKAFATAAQKLGKKALVIMPKTVPSDRVRLIRGLGAEVEQAETAELLSVVAEKEKQGYKFLHSFNSLDLMAGYGSIVTEILKVGPVPDAVIVPCGGGGLISGITLAFRLLGYPEVQIFGVEPEGAAGMQAALKAGKVVQIEAKSVASGLAPPHAGDLTLKVCQELVTGFVSVTDSEITDAQNRLAQLKQIAEPSGAAGVAALIYKRIPMDLAGKKVLVLICGGNTTLGDLMENTKMQ